MLRRFTQWELVMGLGEPSPEFGSVDLGKSHAADLTLVFIALLALPRKVTAALATQVCLHPFCFLTTCVDIPVRSFFLRSG